MTATNEKPAAAEVTHDALFDGAVSLRQPARRVGYRVNVDALLLAAFAARALPGTATEDPRARARHAMDLGSGVGAVALTLLHLDAAARTTLVELDPTLATLATQNLSDNGWTDRGRVVNGDVRRLDDDLHASADLVVCNPPYVVPGRGRAPDPRHAAAKYGDLAAFMAAARRVAGRRAKVCFIYPSVETTSVLDGLRGLGLEAKRLRAVHGRALDPARVILVEAVAGKPGGLAIEPPFIETDARGRRTDTLAALLALPRLSRGDRPTDRARSRTPRAR